MYRIFQAEGERGGNGDEAKMTYQGILSLKRNGAGGAMAGWTNGRGVI